MPRPITCRDPISALTCQLISASMHKRLNARTPQPLNDQAPLPMKFLLRRDAAKFSSRQNKISVGTQQYASLLLFAHGPHKIFTDIASRGISSLTQKSHNACVWLVQEISRSTRATACVCHPAENTRRSRQLRAFDFSPFGRRPKGSCDAALSRDS